MSDPLIGIDSAFWGRAGPATVAAVLSGRVDFEGAVIKNFLAVRES